MGELSERDGNEGR